MQVQERDLEESRNPSNRSESSATTQSNHTTVEDPPIESAEEEKTEKKMDILSNPIFSGFLLIVAGCALAIQAGMLNGYRLIL
jgi:membrane-bound ClpP family serine protease